MPGFKVNEAQWRERVGRTGHKQFCVFPGSHGPQGRQGRAGQGWREGEFSKYTTAICEEPDSLGPSLSF